MSDDFKGRGGSPWGSPPGGGGSGNVVNSGNTTNNVSNNQGIVMPKSSATDGSDSLTNQIFRYVL